MGCGASKALLDGPARIEVPVIGGGAPYGAAWQCATVEKCNDDGRFSLRVDNSSDCGQQSHFVVSCDE